MIYNSDYEIRLATLREMGGDVTKHYDSVYEIDLEILKLTEQGGGSTSAIEEVSELPDASENKEKFFRLDNGDKDVYAAKLLSSETITTNRLPDEQQIDKAYLYTGEKIYYYSGIWTLICNDGEVKYNGWFSDSDGEGNYDLTITIDNAENISSSSNAASYDTEWTFDIQNKTISSEDYSISDIESTLEDDTLESLGRIPIPAIYNAPEANQVGNATLYAANIIDDLCTYTGIQETVTLENQESFTGYKWEVDSDYYVLTDKPASEIYAFVDTTYNIVYSDLKVVAVSEGVVNSQDEILTELNIPQLNAPDSEQVGNAWIEWDAPVQSWVDTYYYIGTLTALDYDTDEHLTLHAFQRSSDDKICGIQTAPSALYTQDYSSIHVWSYNDTDYNPAKWVGEDTGEASDYSTVKYQRTETTEEWGWENITPTYASDSDIDLMFESSSPVVKRVLMKLGSYINEDDEENPSPSSERYPLSILEGLVNENDETMEYDGDTYYKWIKYEDRGNGTSTPDEVGDENVIVLTTSLNPTLPFSSSSPEWVYMIGSESEEAVYASPSTETYPKEALIHEDGSITYEE